MLKVNKQLILYKIYIAELKRVCNAKKLSNTWALRERERGGGSGA